MTALLRRLQAGLDRLCRVGAWLALPLALLLLAQWPLRVLPGGRPQLANDLAQTLFALYVALALPHAWRHGAHLQADVLARRWPAAVRRAIARTLALAVVLPLASALLWLALPQVLQSLRQLEAFPETFNPGYFAIKLAMALLLAALAVQALLLGLLADGGGGAPR